MPKLPGFTFYPGDWMKDPNLRRCSHAAKGVLVDLLCLMFESEERGVLSSSRKPWTDQEIAIAVGGDTTITLAGLRELLDKGVLSRNSSGAVLSRRMIRDETIRTAERDKKRRQRVCPPLCPDGVPPPVPAMSVSEDEDEEGVGDGEGVGGQGGCVPTQADSPLKAALEAFGRWSLRDRGRELNPAHNEYAAVEALLASVAGETPVLRHGEQVRRELLVPHAVESLMTQAKPVPFTSVNFAAGCVRNQLRQWADSGIGVNGEPGRLSRGQIKEIVRKGLADARA